jgi:two-component system chemotaxis response regulator CheB
MIRVLLVDDSVTQREILKRVLEGDPHFEVAGEACNGRDAVAMVEHCDPDVVLMDIHMPEMDGIEATRQIMARHPVPIVVISASLKKHDVDVSLQALEAGAVSVIAKPKGAALLHLHSIAPELRRELVAASQARVRDFRRVAKGRAGDRPAPLRRRTGPVAAIGVCVSTGGPSVLREIFSALPNPFPVPILLVQHISRGFEEGFARWLSDRTGQPARLATDGERLAPGIWLGPAGRHLTMQGPYRMSLIEPGPKDIHCPSGNPLFFSLADQLGPKAVGVQLTGMGNDGAEGLLALKEAGGETIIQDEPSCLIWGMPKAAKELGASVHELNPKAIAELLTRMAENVEKQA